ncbi:LysM peptidoglycan-binding domain-containing protein, partial [Streptomyces sp. NPDC058953]
SAVETIDPSRMSGPDRTSRSDTPGRADARNQGDPGTAGKTGMADNKAGGDSTAEAGPKDGTYTVRSGDNLWAIAEERDVPGGWPALYEANQKVVGADPDLILPGQSLDLQPK